MNSPQHRFALWKKGVKDGIPIGLGYAAVSFGFGILAGKAGLTVFQAGAMSATNLTSAGQLAALGVIAAAGPYVEMALTQCVINLRYSLMACALSQKLDAQTPLFHRFFMAAGITDEIFAVAISASGRLSPFYMYGLMSVAVPGWVLGTVLGIVLGDVLPGRIVNALSVALYGMFIAVVVPPARRNKVVAGVVAVSMLASGVCALVPVLREVSGGVKIILLTLLIAGAAAYFFPVGSEAECDRA